MADVKYDEMTPEELAKHFSTDINKGLTDQQAKEVLERDGPNELMKPPKPTLVMLFIMQLTSFIIVLLSCAAIASIGVNASGPNQGKVLSYTTGMAIFIIVFINAGIAAWTEHKAGDALEALSKMTQAEIYVKRNGKEVKVGTAAVVKGDIIVLGTGDVVPADLRLIEASDLKVSEMALTGEPDDVAKSMKCKPRKEGEPEKLTPENMVFSGCNCTNGKALGVVVDTGMGTRIGRIAQLIAGENGGEMKTKCGCLPDTSGNATPLQQKLEKLGGKIGILAIFVCVVIFIIGVAMNRRDPANGGPAWLYMILIAVTLAVAAIPEGIPLCVTISLSIGCKEMVTKNVLVRKLAAVETLGSASVICSDKTGTLTEGKMTMVGMWSGGVSFDVSGKGFDPTVGKVARESDTSANDNKDLGVQTCLLSALLCCNTELAKVKDPETGVEKWEPKGNSSEAPIVVAAMKVGFAQDVTKQYKRVMEVPFSSSRKMMLTVSDVSGKEALCPGGMPLDPGTKFMTVCKGAPNYIIELTTEMLMPDGSVEPMNDSSKADVLKIVDKYSDKALRVLAIATTTMMELPYDTADEEISTDEKFQRCRQNLRLVGLVASIDPDRDGVKQSVDDATGAGIRVVMITGDYVKTAIAIARNVRILDSSAREGVEAVDCACLRPGGDYLGSDDMDAMTAAVRVFARAKPEDKLEIVKSLQRQGLVTAMTGDGVNDAPALNQADIGVAMGIQGTEVAKGASDMILTDDNFCSIVAAVEKGRAIYGGIQKFVAFIMSVHIAEVVQIFFCIVAGIPVMRTPLQILFLILVTDLPPSIALGMEPGEATILKQRPRPKEEDIVLMWMWVSMIINGAILSVVIICVYFVALYHFCDGKVFMSDIQEIDDFTTKLMDARTVAFIALVWAENVRSYTSRSFDQPVWRNFLGNPQMQKAILLAQICLYVAVLVPGFSNMILGLRGINVGVWGWLVALAGPLGTLVLCEGAKLITYMQVKSYQEKLAKQHEENDKAAVRAATAYRAKQDAKQPIKGKVEEVEMPKDPHKNSDKKVFSANPIGNQMIGPDDVNLPQDIGRAHGEGKPLTGSQDSCVCPPLATFLSPCGVAMLALFSNRQQP